ncbi:hypothetical protein [Novacetimonas pomaceti]|uniref:hypothetical protein n=1 Tax=Novacetimonas pomaceti TaxID=2021998 RepID=UPI001057CD68|nr:hypothetical protein [Novacetimonas pomaceti]
MLEALTLPIIVGVSGHRDIHPGAVQAVGAHVRDILSALSSLYPDNLCVLSALAEGADQMVAETALELGLPLVCVLPMDRVAYRATMTDDDARRRMDALYDHPRTALRFALPPVEAPDQGDVLQYEQLGVFLARQSHILLALWDGTDPDPRSRRNARPRSEKRGGTAHVVSIRTSGEFGDVGVDMFRASRIFSSRLPRLELARCGPILQINTPRATATQDAVAQAGNVRWWSDLSTEQAGGKLPDLRAEPLWETLTVQSLARTWAEILRARMPPDFRFICEARAALAEIRASAPHLCHESAGYLMPAPPDVSSSKPKEASGAEAPGLVAQDPNLGRVRDIFAAADTLSSQSQQFLLGDWAPGLPWKRSAPGRTRLGSLFWFAAAVPLSAICFEVYCEFGKNPALLAGYAGILALATGFYWLRVRRRQWQNLYQDHRALAEALRVQFFWGLSGVPVSVSDNYMRQHEGELGWIRLALRGPSLLAMASALRRTAVPRQGVRQHWIEDQRIYFDRRIRQYKNAFRFSQSAVRLLIGALVTVVVGLLAAQMILGRELSEEWPEWAREMPSVIIGVLPALAAFFLAFRELRLFEEHLHAYGQAASVFDHARRQSEDLEDMLQKNPGDPFVEEEWRNLMIVLGKESLAENAAWIQTHRAHPVTAKLG